METEELLQALFDCSHGTPEYASALDERLAKMSETEGALQKKFKASLSDGQTAQFLEWSESVRTARQLETLLDFAEGMALGAALARVLG